MNLARTLVILAVLAPQAAHAQDGSGGMPRKGFVANLRLAVLGAIGVGSVTTVGAGASAVPSLDLGARFAGRFQVTLGFTFFRTDVAGGGTDTNLFAFVPSFAADILKSNDQKAALYVKVGLPMGALILVPNGPAPTNTGFAVGFDFALGARYAFHPMFALGAEGGVAGFFFNPDNISASGFVSFYGALVGTFYYGR